MIIMKTCCAWGEKQTRADLKSMRENHLSLLLFGLKYFLNLSVHMKKKIQKEQNYKLFCVKKKKCVEMPPQKSSQ